MAITSQWRAARIPHRTRYLRLIDDYARRTLDAQRDWLDAAQEELEPGSSR